MTREIKFRAWYFREEIMLDVDEINHISSRHDKGMLGVNGINRTIGIQGGSHNDCVVMQYTGLKDKNGKEIYEGDVYKIKGATRQDKNGNSRDYNIIYNMVDFLCNEVGGYEGTPTEYMEVIGNIYETPELLPNHPY